MINECINSFMLNNCLDFNVSDESVSFLRSTCFLKCLRYPLAKKVVELHSSTKKITNEVCSLDAIKTNN